MKADPVVKHPVELAGVEAAEKHRTPCLRGAGRVGLSVARANFTLYDQAEGAVPFSRDSRELSDNRKRGWGRRKSKQ